MAYLNLLQKGVCLCALLAPLWNMIGSVANAAAPQMKLTGDFQVETTFNGKTVKLDVAPPTWQIVVDEKYDNLPVYNPNASAWGRGRVLRAVNACECAMFGALEPESVVVKLESTGETLQRGIDYEFEDSSGALGRLEGGKIAADAVVLASYRCIESRIDSIVIDTQGNISLIPGKAVVLSPEPPVLKDGQKRLGNVYLTGRVDKLSEASLFPIDEAFANELNSLDAKAFVENVDRYYAENGGLKASSVSSVGAAKKYLPKTWKKLGSGEEIRILAWGDSVTACGFLPDDQRWQVKFVERLQAMFPEAKITLLTEAWGGRSSDSYRNEPAGSPKNYNEKVLALKPDLIVSEFVNDAYMNEETVAKRYGEMKADFEANGMEWIILGPHYVRPDWMGLSSERDVDDDPRPLVKGLREFTAANNVPFADTPNLYGK
ncbi:MAG: hypothetical protein J6X44_04025, partial [Thermoguttaceae bacterium]|nr:hypothetical protein [Thermoguttaceae bacterium]